MTYTINQLLRPVFQESNVEAQVANLFFLCEAPRVATYWYERAAYRGNFKAMLFLCTAYESGEGGLPVFPERACFWMKQILLKWEESTTTTATNIHDKDTANKVTQVMFSYGVHMLGAFMPQDPSQSQEQEVDIMASKRDFNLGIQWLEKAGNRGHVVAASLLGNIYKPRKILFGNNCKPEKGIEWLRKAAELGDGDCAFHLAKVYGSGQMPVNKHLRKKWLKVADRLGMRKANEYLKQMDQEQPPMSAKEAEKELSNLEKERGIESFLPTGNTTECSNPACDKQEEENVKFPSCNRCKHAKYCSPACQESHFYAGHYQQCEFLERAKERIKVHKRAPLLSLANRCSYPPCNKKADKAPEGLKKCARCKMVKYCCRPCQSKHWKSGHREVCHKTAAEMDRVTSLLARLKNTKTK